MVDDILREMIGGPLHGKSIACRTKRIIFPVIPNYNFPKAERRRHMFGQVVYEKLDINGKHYLRFVEGYY